MKSLVLARSVAALRVLGCAIWGLAGVLAIADEFAAWVIAVLPRPRTKRLPRRPNTAFAQLPGPWLGDQIDPSRPMCRRHSIGCPSRPVTACGPPGTLATEQPAPSTAMPS